ncbi:hypothetical protein TRFO_26768 [Tritrichomonas foetus]|uniref:FERM central domain-containing protein n=1 Tax=Tritrichomonas foetus TaxID=1144522 RepID=A0A1J4K3T1_9EUKA|nr:hypothetical protein TRFO_26768 [Tritrichomonas foetus]|eukprot:OHT05496.1 hypothetical protein TRFO_26768 [Tritrichomonas foetus]
MNAQSQTQIIGIEASIFGSSDQPVSTTIPSSLKGKDIINFLKFSHSMKIPDGACIIIMFVSETKYAVSYRILDNDKDLSQYLSRQKRFQILLYPPKMMIHIHCADGRVSIREYASTTPAAKIVEDVCKIFFHLNHHIAYALYGNINDLSNPIPQTKSIIEFNPSISDVWLLRRFWIKASTALNDESDIHFNFSHAKNIVFSKNFSFRRYKWEDLIAISLTLDYSTYEQAKMLLKKEKKEISKLKKNEKKMKKEKAKKKGKNANDDSANQHKHKSVIDVSHLPVWFILDKKEKKRKNEIIELVRNYENMNILELKLKFLKICLENEYFGARMFPVRCKIPFTNSSIQECNVCFTENFYCLLKKDTEEELFKVKLTYVRKWKPTDIENMHFFFITKESRELYDLHIQAQNVFTILDYFTSLINFLKQQSILGKQDDTVKSEKKVVARMDKTSLSDIISANNINDYIPEDEDEPEIYEMKNRQDSNISKIDPPSKQTVELLDIEKLCAKSEIDLTLSEYTDYYDHITGYSFDAIPYQAFHNNIIQTGCNLLKRVVFQESLSPIADATVWVQGCLPEDLLTQSVLSWLLQGPSDTIDDAISTVSNLTAYVFQDKLCPLDAFVALNYSRSILMHYARQKWRTIDFGELAYQADETLGNFIKTITQIIKRNMFPISTLIFEDTCDFIPDSLSMLHVNESIALNLFFATIAVARAMCNAGISADVIQPILSTLPVVNTYDPVVAYSLSDILLPLVNSTINNEIAHQALISQPHIAKLDINSISSCITELYNYTHYLTTPVAIFCKTRSPRLLNTPFTPSTVPEAAYIFQIARESAVTLWNIKGGVQSALAQEISWAAIEFYSLFTEAARDPSLAEALGGVFKFLLDCLEHSSIIIKDYHEFEDVLDNFEASEAVLSTLIGSNEDSKTTMSLIAMESSSPEHRSIALEECSKEIDSQLRSLTDKCTEEEISKVSDAFRVFSLMILSIQNEYINKGLSNSGKKDAASLNVTRGKLTDCGNKLLTVIKDEKMDNDERRKCAQDLINDLREFSVFTQELQEATREKEIVITKVDTSKIKPYEQVEKHD